MEVARVSFETRTCSLNCQLVHWPRLTCDFQLDQVLLMNHFQAFSTACPEAGIRHRILLCLEYLLISRCFDPVLRHWEESGKARIFLKLVCILHDLSHCNEWLLFCCQFHQRRDDDLFISAKRTSPRPADARRPSFPMGTL
jgi:hypothetical protein